jgi:tetratricopeptide (TPR) repeat protein
MVEDADQAGLLNILLDTQKYVDELSSYSRTQSVEGREPKPFLWNYEYMFYNRLSEFFLVDGNVSEEVKYRRRAVSVWWDIYEAGEHNKFGPNPHDLLADPHGAVAIMLDRYAVLVCNNGAGEGGEIVEAIRATDQSIAFHREVWDPREFHPSSVTANHIDRLYTKAYCLQRLHEEDKTGSDSSNGKLSQALEHLREALALTEQLPEGSKQGYDLTVMSSMQAVEQKLKISDNSHKKSGRFWRKGKK